MNRIPIIWVIPISCGQNLHSMETPTQDDSPPETSAYNSYTSGLWSIYGQSIERDCAALRTGLTSLQKSAQNIFEEKISSDIDRQILYAFYALSKNTTIEKALSKNTFEQITSLIRSFYLLKHVVDLRPYFATTVFSASHEQIEKYCKQITQNDVDAITALLSQPSCLYQRVPHKKPKFEKTSITRCGKNPIIMDSEIWSIHPIHEQELWCESLKKNSGLIALVLAKPLTALCRSEKQIFAATSEGAVIRPFLSDMKITCDEITVCDHPIAFLATTQSGNFIIAGNAECCSIIQTSNGSYVTHKIPQFTLHAIGIRDTKKNRYEAIAVGMPGENSASNIFGHTTFAPQKQPTVITKKLVFAKSFGKIFSVGKGHTIHTPIITKTDKWGLVSVRTDLIPELTAQISENCHIPETVADRIELISTNYTGLLSIASITRKKIGKSWILWDHTADEMHEIPDENFDVVVPDTVTENGIISILAGNQSMRYFFITINARPHLDFIRNPSSSFKSKLFLLAVLGAHILNAPLSIEDDIHWKSSFNELPTQLQAALTEYYPLFTKSLLTGFGKSTLKQEGE